MTETPTIAIQLLCFGIARDLTAAPEITLHLRSRPDDPLTIAHVRKALLESYPAFGDLVSFAIARNEAYARDADPVVVTDVLAIIPPVSGG